MGSSIVLPTKDPPKENDTYETNAKIPKLLESIPGIKLGENIRIGYKPGNEAYNAFPEFTISEVTHGLYQIYRKDYRGDQKKCCTIPSLNHYWEDKDGKIFQKYDTGRKLKTCDPFTKTISGSTMCDNILTNLCIDANSGIDRTICDEWMGYALTRPDTSITDSINDRYIRLCSKDVNNSVCEDWLHHLRIIGGKKNDDIIDEVLLQQSPEFKSKYMKCSFPSHDTIFLSDKVIEPRECWDQECINSNVHFLLSKNYHNLSLCHIYRCNVSINNLLIDNKSSVKISCHDETLTKGKYNTNRRKNFVNNILSSSFVIKTEIFFVLFILLALLLIVLL
ncbi:putative myristylated protein [Cheloniid poxvirus 1]|nr:putative myristylated protein [Cheloniid poxvirus 1]